MTNVFDSTNGVTSQEISLIKQRNKDIYVSIELFNKNDDGTADPHTLWKGTPIKKLDGNLVSDSLNVDSESTQRRTYTCNLTLTDKNLKLHDLEIAANSDIWIDKYIRVYYGIKSNRDHQIYYWLIGTFTFVTPNYTYSINERTLSISCSDLMADYDGTKNGQITGTNVIGEVYTSGALALNMSYTFKICSVSGYKKNADGTFYLDDDGLPVAEGYVKIHDAICAVCRMAGISEDMMEIDDYVETDKNGDPVYETDAYGNYIDFDGNVTTDSSKYVKKAYTIPYDLEFEPGKTYAEVWQEIADLYTNYEFFFDINGKFIWRKIPTNIKEKVVLNNKLIDPLLVSEVHNNSFSGIYNATEVWGKSFELSLNDRYVEQDKVSYNNGVYTIQLPIVKDSSIKDEYYRRIESYIDNYDKIAITIPQTNNSSSTKLTIHGILKDSYGTQVDEFDLQSDNGTQFPIYNSTGEEIDASSLLPEQVYVFTYRRDLEVYDTNSSKYYKINACFVLGGQVQCYGYYVETNKNCPYAYNPEAKAQGYPCLDYLIPNRVSVETDYTDDLCKNRAEKLTWESCCMKDTVDLTTIIIPWLEVNQKIRYVLQRTDNREQVIKDAEAQANEIDQNGYPDNGSDSIDLHEWIIKNFSWSTMDGTMSISAYKFREDFEYIWNRRNQ